MIKTTAQRIQNCILKLILSDIIYIYNIYTFTYMHLDMTGETAFPVTKRQFLYLTFSFC